MPIYEYVCDACRHKFEAYLRAWGEAVACPACGNESVEKQISRFAVAGSDGSFSASVSGGCGCGRGCGCHH